MELDHTPAPPVQGSKPPLDMGEELWQEILSTLRARLAPKAFEEFLAGAKPSYCDSRSIVVEVPNAYHRNWIYYNCLDLIEETLENLLGVDEVSVELHIKAEGQLESSVEWLTGGGGALLPEDETFPGIADEDGVDPPEPGGFPASPASSAPLPAPKRLASASGPPKNGSKSPNGSKRPAWPQKVSGRRADGLNQRHAFENYVIGESNRFAHAAALKASDPTIPQAYNPLFIYGGVGLGKTHLMQAIGLKMLESHPEKKVVYATSEQFMNDFIGALAEKGQMEFRSLYRNVDLLLVDDVQFFIGKEQTQTEFFYTFNELYESGRRIVFSSDRPPRELQPLEERLRSRFEWGLIVDIQLPNVETRAAIAQKKAELEGVRLPRDVAYYIAERVQSNVRELEGALQRLIASAAVQERAIDMEVCAESLGHLLCSNDPPPELTVEEVQRATCEYFSIETRELVGQSRVKRLARPRHIAQYLSRQLTGLSYPEIGKRFNRSNHTSVIHACKKVERDLQADAQLANCVNFLTKRLQGAGGLEK